VTAAAFSGIFGDTFTNWDDDVYVTGNFLVHSLSWQNLCRTFSPATFVNANYQPLTLFSYALNYAFGRLNPVGYLLTDLLLHLSNVLLVFVFVRKLFVSDFIASFCALLFGVHPMHVESVAWIAGRKDLLYTGFFLASCLLYMAYTERKPGSAGGRYAASVVLFIFSLLSKSSALTLPIILCLIDCFRGRKFSAGAVIDKIPFIIPALLIGFLAIWGQHKAGTFAAGGDLSLYSRLAIGSWSLLFYLVKFIIPVQLSAFYPFPDTFPRSLPLLYSLAPPGIVLLAGAVWRFRRSKRIIFGFGFFLINVMFILHFIPVSTAITADRFTYLAYVGLSMVAAVAIERALSLTALKRVRGTLMPLLPGVLALAAGLAARERSAVWESSETLWTDVIAHYPSAIAFNNRGYAYFRKQDYPRALSDYTTGIARYPSFADLYNDRGLLYDALGNLPAAIEDYSRAIGLKPGYAGAYCNRGADYFATGNEAGALSDLDRAIALKPDGADAYYNRGNIMGAKGDFPAALDDYNRAVALNPENAGAWYNLGRSYRAMGQPIHALACYTRTIGIDSSFYHAFNSRGILFCREERFTGALADFNRAIAIDPSLPDAFFNRGLAFQALGEREAAERDFRRACELHMEPACRELGGR
jgi:tetratricopeptide (TPR) repeat protein